MAKLSLCRPLNNALCRKLRFHKLSSSRMFRNAMFAVAQCVYVIRARVLVNLIRPLRQTNCWFMSVVFHIRANPKLYSIYKIRSAIAHLTLAKYRHVLIRDRRHSECFVSINMSMFEILSDMSSFLQSIGKLFAISEC